MINSKSFFVILLIFINCFAMAGSPTAVRNVVIPQGSVTSKTITLLWDKPERYSDVTGYQIYKEGKLIGQSTKTNFTADGLASDKKYTFLIKAVSKAGELFEASKTVSATTKPAGKIFNVLDFGAKGDGETKNTKVIQQAIDACTAGGTVYIPSGKFLTGALFLKSNMTLYIAEGGILKGSTDTLDYLPVILNRFEGWELKTYASLINAGTLNRSGKFNVFNLSIQGKGTISGGGFKLRDAMIAHRGKRGRGRLICIMNGQNIDVQGLHIEESQCWNIHYIYCNQVTIHDVDIVSHGANADGIDPDSSTDSYIFNCSIATDDDCIAIKSGKNPEGNVVNKPTERVRITDCTFTRGAALAIGSELSGGVSDVFIQDCKIGNLKNGLQIKTTKDRGGYVKNVTMRDCSIMKINIVTDVNYNNDGAPAPNLSYFKNMRFTNLKMAEAAIKEPVININGFPNVEHFTRDIIFDNVVLPRGAVIKVKNCDNFVFKNILDTNGGKPIYEIKNSTNIIK